MNKLFNDDKLNQLLDEYSDDMQAVYKKADKISADIKQIENIISKFPLEGFEFLVLDNKFEISNCRLVFKGKPVIEHKLVTRFMLKDSLPLFLEEYLNEIRNYVR